MKRYLTFLFFSIFLCLGIHAEKVFYDGSSYWCAEGPNAGTASLEKANSSVESFTIPTYVTSSQGRRCLVTSIGTAAFKNCFNLRSVTFNDYIEEVGFDAFRDCRNLSTVNMNEGLQRIRSSAFKNCGELVYLYVPSTVTTIEQSVFEDCIGLKSVDLPSGLNVLSTSLFSGCKSLEFFIFPSGVTSMEGHLFSGCTNLRNVTLSENLTSIPSYSFSSCESLKSIKLGDKITSIGQGAFTYSGLTSVVLGKNVKTIDYAAFQQCNDLTSITLNANLEYIDGYALRDCNNLSLVVSGAKVPPVCENDKVFSYETLKNAILLIPQDTETAYAAADYWNQFKHIQAMDYDLVVDGIYYKLDLGENKATVTRGEDPYSLSTVIPASVELKGRHFDVNAIDPIAFIGCENLEYISIPKGVSLIPEGLFEGCQNLSTVRFEDANSPLFIENNLNLPWESVYVGRDIDFNVSPFEQCKTLSEVVWGNEVTRIKENSFRGCSALERISLPASVSYIGENAFVQCLSLDTVSVYATTPPSNDTGKGFFDNETYINGTLFVPEAAKGKYMSSKFWKGFFTVEVLPDSETNIENVTLQKDNTDHTYYDLNGRKVLHPTKGIFIVNGKKVILK